jgi:hypothetical protein
MEKIDKNGKSAIFQIFPHLRPLKKAVENEIVLHRLFVERRGKVKTSIFFHQSPKRCEKRGKSEKKQENNKNIEIKYEFSHFSTEFSTVCGIVEIPPYGKQGKGGKACGEREEKM